MVLRLLLVGKVVEGTNLDSDTTDVGELQEFWMVSPREDRKETTLEPYFASVSFGCSTAWLWTMENELSAQYNSVRWS